MIELDFEKIKKYMINCMDVNDIAHDCNHVYRVLSNANELMKYYDVDSDVLIASCLLHDIARVKESQNPSINHAELGAKMALDFLLNLGWDNIKALKVSVCISNHRSRSEDISIEAKLLYDSDKLDLTGAIGIARNIAHCALNSDPIYILDDENQIEYRKHNANYSILEVLKENIDSAGHKFYTPEAQKTADKHLDICSEYYQSLCSEIKDLHTLGHNNKKF